MVILIDDPAVCPEMLSPQQRMFPPVTIAQVRELPAEIAVAVTPSPRLMFVVVDDPAV